MSDRSISQFPDENEDATGCHSVVNKYVFLMFEIEFSKTGCSISEHLQISMFLYETEISSTFMQNIVHTGANGQHFSCGVFNLVPPDL